MVAGAHDGPTTTGSDSEYEFENFNPVLPMDHVLVNRLRKQTRTSVEPVDQDQLLNVLKKGNKTKKSSMKEGTASELDMDISENFRVIADDFR